MPHVPLLILERTRARVLSVLWFAGIAAALLASLFTSPAVTIALMLGVGVLVLAWMYPQGVLFALLAYLPFEPFLLKWIPDSVYILARYASELTIYILCAVVLVRIFLKRTSWRQSPIDIPFLFFLITILASVIVNLVHPTIALLGARQLIRFILLFFVTVQLKLSRRWIRGMFVALCAIVLVQIGLAFAQTLSGGALDATLLPSERRMLGNIQLTDGTQQFWDPGQRVFGTLGRYDQLGTFLAFVLLAVIAYAYETPLSPARRIAFGLFLVGGIGALLLTYSRSSWFGFLLGLLLIAIVIKKDRRAMIAAVCVPLLMACYIATSNFLVDKLVDTPRQTLVERFFEAFSVSRWYGEYVGLGRVYWMVETFKTVLPSSPLFGVGPGQYGGGAVAALGNTLVYDRLGLPFGVFGTHGFIDNNWLSLWGEVGTLGIAAFMWMYATLFLLALRTALTHPDRETRIIGAATAAALAAFALHAFLATFFEVRTLAPYVWVLCGILISHAGLDPSGIKPYGQAGIQSSLKTMDPGL